MTAKLPPIVLLPVMLAFPPIATLPPMFALTLILALPPTTRLPVMLAIPFILAPIVDTFNTFAMPPTVIVALPLANKIATLLEPFSNLL